MYNIFIHSSVDGHLGCFYVLRIVNSASLNTEVLYTHFFYHFNLLTFIQIMEEKSEKMVKLEDDVLAIILETILQNYALQLVILIVLLPSVSP